MSTPNVENLTPELINNLLSIKPEIRDELVSAIDEKIAQLSKMRSVVAGKKPRASKKASKDKPAKEKASKKISTPDTSGNTLKHKEAVLKVLEMDAYKAGASSRQIREAAEGQLKHVFGSSLGTTLNLMREAKELKGKPNKEGKQLIYFV